MFVEGVDEPSRVDLDLLDLFGDAADLLAEVESVAIRERAVGRRVVFLLRRVFLEFGL